MIRKLSDLQKKPYEQRLRILKLGVMVAVILIIALWVLTIKSRNMENQPSNNGLSEIITNFKEIWQK